GDWLASGRGRLAQVPGGFSLSGGAQNLDNRAEDRSVSVDDVTHVLNMSWTYELPFGPGRSFGNNAGGIRRLLVQGWKISGSFNAQSGIPLQIRGPRNGLTNRVNVVGDPAAGGAGNTRYQLEQQWFNPNAFQAVFAFTHLPRNDIPQQS